MQLNLRALAISFTIIFGLLILVLSIWSRVSTSFGKEFMDVFNSIHPHPFRATLSGLSSLEQVYGVALDLFYGVVDALLFSLGFGLLYNKFAGTLTSPAGQDSKE